MTVTIMAGRLCFQSSKDYKCVCVADGMYLIEEAGIITDWIIACNCPNYTIIKTANFNYIKIYIS